MFKNCFVKALAIDAVVPWAFLILRFICNTPVKSDWTPMIQFIGIRVSHALATRSQAYGS